MRLAEQIKTAMSFKDFLRRKSELKIGDVFAFLGGDGRMHRAVIKHQPSWKRAERREVNRRRAQKHRNGRY